MTIQPGAPAPPPTRLALALDRNDAALRALIDQHAPDLRAIRCAVFARCWPDDLPRRGAVNIHLQARETLDGARQRLGLRWNPQWLLDAGFAVFDGGGTGLPDIHSPAATPGPVVWNPDPLLPRIDDQSRVQPGAVGSDREQQIVAGCVSVAALWSSESARYGIGLAEVDLALSALPARTAGQVRGARFANALAYALESTLPPGWRVETEVNITDIFGLHLRSNVANRSADIVVIGPDDKVMAFVSSKFSWRSDRGTEAAQMVFLQRYRPDLPYVLVTAEFPRALGGVLHESIEDQAFHLVPTWVTAWHLTQELPDAGDALPTLAALRQAAEERQERELLAGVDDLLAALRTTRHYL